MSRKRPKLRQRQVHLPDEIIFDIISRLPIESLSRCKLVCKTWNKNIKDPLFINLHHSGIDQADPNFLIFCRNDESISKFYLSHIFKPLKPMFSIRSKNKIEIIGSSNGLMCLSSLPVRKSFIICNPITKEILKLPTPSCRNPYVRSRPYNLYQYNPCGFAFDAASNTYKIVRTWSDNESKVDTRSWGAGVDILTFGSEKWRTVAYIPSSFFNPLKTFQLFLNGALHWQIFTLVKNSPQYIHGIAAIDVGSEKLRTLKQPPFNDRKIRTRSMGLLRDCLCLNDDLRDDDDRIVVWVMKEYGLEDSWAVLYNIEKNTLGPLHNNLRCIVVTKGNKLPQGTRDFGRDYEFDKGMLGVMKNGSTLLNGGKDFGYYDYEGELFEQISIRGIPKCDDQDLDVALHVGSLVSPRSITG